MVARRSTRLKVIRTKVVTIPTGVLRKPEEKARRPSFLSCSPIHPPACRETTAEEVGSTIHWLQRTEDRQPFCHFLSVPGAARTPLCFVDWTRRVSAACWEGGRSEPERAMSVLGRRLAGTEGAYFLQESKNAVGRLAAQKKKQNVASKGEQNPSPSAAGTVGGGEPLEAEASADVLPEILRHSIPLQHQQVSPSSFAGGSKWSLGSDPTSSRPLDGMINPLRDYVALPQVTFGPKRWQLPDEQGSVLASTANELRRDRYQQPIDPEKLKAAAAELSQIGKAFAVATAIIFGGATSIVALTVSKLEIQTSDDVRTKGRDLIQPRADLVRENMAPLRTWAENMSRKWRYSGENETKENPFIQQLSKMLGSKDL